MYSQQQIIQINYLTKQLIRKPLVLALSDTQVMSRPAQKKQNPYQNQAQLVNLLWVLLQTQQYLMQMYK